MAAKASLVFLASNSDTSYAEQNKAKVNLPAAAAAISADAAVVCFGYLSALRLVQHFNEDDPAYATKEMQKFKKGVELVSVQYTYLMKYRDGESDLQPGKAMAQGISSMKSDPNHFHKVVGECTKNIQPFMERKS